MRCHLEELVGNEAEDITATTFHSRCFKLLFAETGSPGDKPDKLVVYDAVAAQQLVERAIEDAYLNGASIEAHSLAPSGIRSAAHSPTTAPSRWMLEEVAFMSDRAKDNLYAPEDFVRMPGDFFEESMAMIYARDQELVLENNAVDDGDLDSAQCAAFAGEPWHTWILPEPFPIREYSTMRARRIAYQANSANTG